MNHDQKFFFVHIMKVGGFSLFDMLSADVFPDPNQVFPSSVGARPTAVRTDYSVLKSVITERGENIRLYCGHYPYAAVHLMGANVKTFALFRDPVDRAISHLKHLRNIPLYKELSPEQMYEDEKTFQSFLDNLQLRMFAIPSLDQAGSAFEPTPLTEADIERALEAVQKLDVIGLTAEFSDFVRMLELQFGWSFKRLSFLNKSPPWKISPELRERISEDLTLDERFYEGVRKIYTERKQELIAKHGGWSSAMNS